MLWGWKGLKIDHGRLFHVMDIPEMDSSKGLSGFHFAFIKKKSITEDYISKQ